MNITKEDKKYLDIVIEEAEKSYKLGNYPVGACLVIDGKLIGRGGNRITSNKSYLYHAEMGLIVENSEKIYEGHEDDKFITLYTSLEPCIQCLGASVTNRIDKIVYLVKDPNGGACDLEHDKIGDFYHDHWPEIVYAPMSKKPLDLMIKYFKGEIQKGNDKWPKKMLGMYGVK